MRFGICAPYREVAALETYPFDYLEENVQRFLIPTQSVDTKRLERYMKTALQRAEQVGIRIIVFGSGWARVCPPDYSHTDALQQIGAHFSQWSEWAQNHGVEIVLEPLRYEETNTLNTVTEAGEFVANINRPGARLLADFYHMAYNLLSHVHVAEKRDRAAPGRYGEDFRPFFAALHQAGYDRRISIECIWQSLAAEVPPAIETLREQWMTSAR